MRLSLWIVQNAVKTAEAIWSQAQFIIESAALFSQRWRAFVYLLVSLARLLPSCRPLSLSYPSFGRILAKWKCASSTLQGKRFAQSSSNKTKSLEQRRSSAFQFGRVEKVDRRGSLRPTNMGAWQWATASWAGLARLSRRSSRQMAQASSQIQLAPASLCVRLVLNEPRDRRPVSNSRYRIQR